MHLLCQDDSYLKEADTKVVRVDPDSDNESLVEVELKETLFFPDGGGQNTDHGWIGPHKVVNVERLSGGNVVHHVRLDPDATPLQNGDIVHLTLDWDRRFDHMQQHSAQHLLSALLNQEFGFETTSWWMAENKPSEVGVSYIEIQKMSDDGSDDFIVELENMANDRIRSHGPVKVSSYSKSGMNNKIKGGFTIW